DVLFALIVATGADSDRHHGVQFFLDVPDEADYLFGALDWNFDFDNRGHQFFAEDVLANGARRIIRHERRHGILLFECDAGVGKRPTHFLNLGHAHADAGAAKLDGEAYFADLH